MRVLNYNVAYPIKNFLGNIQRLTWAGLLIIVGPMAGIYAPFIEGTLGRTVRLGHKMILILNAL